MVYKNDIDNGKKRQKKGGFLHPRSFTKIYIKIFSGILT